MAAMIEAVAKIVELGFEPIGGFSAESCEVCAFPYAIYAGSL